MTAPPPPLPPLPPLQPPNTPHILFFPILCLWRCAGKSNPVSWMRMLLIMREYCHRYSQQPDEDQEQPRQARQDCLVPAEDVAGLSAFLRLFSQVWSSFCCSSMICAVTDAGLLLEICLAYVHAMLSCTVLCAVLCQLMPAMSCLLGHRLLVPPLLNSHAVPCFGILCTALPIFLRLIPDTRCTVAPSAEPIAAHANGWRSRQVKNWVQGRAAYT